MRGVDDLRASKDKDQMASHQLRLAYKAFL
jgi:hypothetical protein